MKLITTYTHADYISLDCGSPAGTNYTEDGINYISDENFIEGGVSVDLSATKNNRTGRIYNTRRSFPNNTRNCYTLRPRKGKNNKYLIRAKFYYGDPNGQIPEFDVSFGGDTTKILYTVSLSDPFYVLPPDMIHVSTSDFISICLINKGRGYPFITTLELRPLDMTMYQVPWRLLLCEVRFDYGTNDELVRYKDDKYDRKWGPYIGDLPATRAIEASETVVLKPFSDERVPIKVMKTATTPISSAGRLERVIPVNADDEYIFYIHLAEVEILKDNQKREFDISINGNWIATVSPSTTITTITSDTFTGSSSYWLRLIRTENSTLPPILNAYEVYALKQLPQKQTDDQDAAAIWSAKSSYGLKNLNWQGDPCAPETWVGLNCNSNVAGAYKIISLNLSSQGLSGDITIALANLTMIQTLDLSNNNLTGNVPKFLAQLKDLTTLNLLGNNFTRPLPIELIAKSKKGLLQLSIEGVDNAEDAISCPNSSCNKKKHKKSLIIPILAPIVGCIFILFIIICTVKQRRKKAFIKRFSTRKQQYTYSELVVITNNFKEVIGSGGFGRVYLGAINDIQVAVKMLSKSSPQSYEDFQAEIRLVMNIRHKNITTLLGYCDDRRHKGIIYEFMSEGSLEEHLFDRNEDVLSWERRIQIGYDVAEGLAYMHHGCMPPIVHRDIKPSNILLSGGFEAKLADFGLSRAFPSKDASHLTADLVGTMCYLDPQCWSTRRVTEKNDVYSFGVVILVLITSRQAILNGINITQWVKSLAEKGNVENIIDPKLLDGRFDKDVASKVVKIAIDCVSIEPNERPTMNDVAIALKQCVQVVVKVDK